MNMATDNRPITELAGAGSILARGVVPPTNGYPAPHAPVSISEKVYDVLAFNPAAAREILATAGHRLRVECTAPSPSDAPLWAQVLHTQWEANLDLELMQDVRGLSPRVMGCPAFKYAWIDTNRRPS